MLVNIQKSYRDIVSICDSELLGKKFEEGNFQLEIKESFFKGNEKTKEEVLDIIEKMTQEDATFNIVGEKSVQTAIDAGIINPESVKKIQGIPFAMVLL